jgi:hypothetical protein
MFHDLYLMTLRKDDNLNPFVLNELKSGNVTKDVDVFLNKNIIRCASEIIWNNSRPTAILATFFKEKYHSLSQTVFLA